MLIWHIYDCIGLNCQCAQFCDIPELTLPVCDLPGVVMLYSSLELYQDWSWLNAISYLRLVMETLIPISWPLLFSIIWVLVRLWAYFLQCNVLAVSIMTGFRSFIPGPLLCTHWLKLLLFRIGKLGIPWLVLFLWVGSKSRSVLALVVYYCGHSL